MVTLAYDDLLPLKYAARSYDLQSGALDCYGATAEIVARAHGEAARSAFLALIEKPTHNWEDVGDVVEPGDVVVSLAGNDLHVSGVAATMPALVVSAARGFGVYAQRLSTVRDIVGIYRYPEAGCR